MGPKYPKLYDKTWLEKQLAEHGLNTYTAVAKKLGCTASAVGQACRKFKLELPPAYPELQNKEWLQQKYTTERLACIDISKLVGCHKDGVRAALVRHGISLRDNRESTLVHNASHPAVSKYDKLNDKEWLIEQYINKRRSMRSLAKELGCADSNSIGQWLKKHSIAVRTISEALTINRTTILCLDYELLIGCLLGDAGLSKYNKGILTKSCVI